MKRKRKPVKKPQGITRIKMSPTITFSQFNSPWVSRQGMQVSSTGGDSSCSWVFVRALGHNLGRDAGDTFNSLHWGVQSEKEIH